MRCHAYRHDEMACVVLHWMERAISTGHARRSARQVQAAVPHFAVPLATNNTGVLLPISTDPASVEARLTG
jgi:hypothetical protein